MTTRQIADAWIDNHLPREWKQLLAIQTKSPGLPNDVLAWLAKFVPGFRDKMRNGFATFDGLATEEALARFEDDFIANLTAAVERPG